MEKFDVNELLRYLIIGIFVIFINYLNLDNEIFKEQIQIIGVENISTVLIGLSILFGFFLYVFYRSIFYPLFFNPIITCLTNNKRKRIFPEYSKLGVFEIIKKTDVKRWGINSEGSKKRLYEWASQIHFLYNLSISCFISLIIDWHPYLFIFSIILLSAAALHHVRYKYFEIEVLTP